MKISWDTEETYHEGWDWSNNDLSGSLDDFVSKSNEYEQSKISLIASIRSLIEEAMTKPGSEHGDTLPDVKAKIIYLRTLISEGYLRLHLSSETRTFLISEIEKVENILDDE